MNKIDAQSHKLKGNVVDKCIYKQKDKQCDFLFFFYSHKDNSISLLFFPPFSYFIIAFPLQKRSIEKEYRYSEKDKRTKSKKILLYKEKLVA